MKGKNSPSVATENMKCLKNLEESEGFHEENGEARLKDLTTTSAWNQAKGYEALEQLRMCSKQERQRPHSRGLAAKLQVLHICLILHHIWSILI